MFSIWNNARLEVGPLTDFFSPVYVHWSGSLWCLVKSAVIVSLFCGQLLNPEICRLTKRASSILIWSGLPLLILHFRWLVSKGRISEAVANFKWLRGCDDNTAQLVVHTLHEEMSKQQQKFHLVELFQCEIFKPFGISLLSMVFQQFTGLFVLLFYTQVNLIRRC